MSLRYFVLGLLAAFAVSPAPANTLVVTNTGNDASPDCNFQAPCQTLSFAVDRAGINDTILCVGPVISKNAIVITKAVDINCSGGPVSFRDSALGIPNAAIRINIPATATTSTVRLRGLSLFGGLGDSKFVQIGIQIQSAAVVSIEGSTISDMRLAGIIANSAGATKLFVTDTIIRNCDGPGIGAGAAPGSVAVLDNVRSENNQFGLTAGNGNKVTIVRSVLAGNSVAGVEGDTGALVVVDSSAISNNSNGVVSHSSVRLSNNNILFNNTAINGAAGTFGNNRLSGNISAGTAPTPLGGASNEFAQQ